jgi:hypothetical protein
MCLPRWLEIALSHLRTLVLLVIVAVAVAPVPARTSQVPTAPDLLKAAAEYLDTYATKISGTALDELFILVETVGPQMMVPQRLYSDVVIVKIDVQGQLLGLRDLFAVDKKNLRPREPRITDALERPSLASWEAVQGFGREHAVYFRSNGVIWFSDPVLALQFANRANQSRLTYKVDGSKKVNGVQVYGLGFKEIERPAGHLLGTPDNPQASGRLWINPATGAIYETDVWVQSETETARLRVIYALDPARSILLPHESSGTFETRQIGSGGNIGPRATRAAFDVSVTYTNPRYLPIDLTRISR